LAKSGVIHFNRLYRVLCDACVIAKLPKPRVDEVLDSLAPQTYFLLPKSLFIAKSTAMFPNSKRQQALCNYVVRAMAQNKDFTVDLGVLKTDLETNFRELKPILDKVGQRVNDEGLYSLKNFDEENLELPLSEANAK